MRAVALATLGLICACVSTQMTPLAGFSPARARTCWQGVQVYMTAVDTPYVELAYLHAEASDPVKDEKVMRSLRDKAAEIGADGILFKGMGTTHNVGLVSGVLQAKPTGEAVALWIPRDSLKTAQQCAAVADSAANP